MRCGFDQGAGRSTAPPSSWFAVPQPSLQKRIRLGVGSFFFLMLHLQWSPCRRLKRNAREVRTPESARTKAAYVGTEIVLKLSWPCETRHRDWMYLGGVTCQEFIGSAATLSTICQRCFSPRVFHSALLVALRLNCTYVGRFVPPVALEEVKA